MSQNFLYALECLIDDLVITHPNECAPEEYPTCVEISFRSNIFMSVCEGNFNKNDINNNKNNTNSNFIKSGKSCLFALDKPITENDKLKISVFKKKVEKCKFLIGSNDIPIRHLFDKTTEKFKKINVNALQRNQKNKNGNEENGNQKGGQEECIPTSEVTKKLLSLFDTQGKQAGNVIIFIRLSCIGPVITSTFSFKGLRQNDSCLKNANSFQCPSVKPSKSRNKNVMGCKSSSFASANDCISENNMEYLGFKQAPSQCSESKFPCIIEATRKIEGPEEYDEFEADLNGSGITIRVLKSKHKVQNVADDEFDCGSSSTGIFQKNQGGLEPNLINCPAEIQPAKRMGNGKVGKLRKKNENRSCCLQVAGVDIDNVMQGINHTTPNGIEICRKGCMNSEVDVFILKLGKKKSSQGKKNIIEIELKTPKNPDIGNKQKITKDSQIDEETLDREMNNLKENDKKNNNKENAKGKGKGKGKKKKGKK